MIKPELRLAVMNRIGELLVIYDLMKETDLTVHLLSWNEEIKREEIQQIISELVQSSEIIRLEYIAPGDKTRSSIYFPFGTQIK